MTINKSINIIGVILVVAIVGIVLFGYGKNPQPTQTPSPSISPTPTGTLVSPSPSPSASKPSETPLSFSLAVPFTPQAPIGNWDQLHNEACEEASAIMAGAYFAGDTREKIPAAEVEIEITKLTKWQDTNFGYYLDTDAVETAEMIESVYGLKTNLVKNFTENDIKSALLAGKVLIIPVNGRKLNNPNYKQPGPIYHMLVIRGYTATKIITNDSGTRNGENYLYSFSTINNATADWDHAIDTIDESKSVMIVVSK
ncbi:MAG: hypothetical protein UW46_C0006G0033 [Candidatus Yanofskybacteria bacterium GW2011_GWF1_44_227]|uniref:Peptidase C39-like domain-containing protein n=1 Tax=Candidatus Yanofskybacteria bacterium GW2011_GWE2_40_11 TaxID=1619033 RepID=A0A0G0T023_9BACT|nr:MAG: hypothetical protein UT69_C0002G0028 [Candidatus Yanofskybacteria bacterium GW2011_GWE1_40_10]KKR40480.1 MAG: hypothetical protein UT75_C0008G0002 [Candidatus Yanofskybacteria bacterium GW2011_GWE2_40_11]KKT15452.1 MAG: hypothetical protein UV97_C0006G0019 [Candidatus Yanofskybacteria bacterium GW2011_GWF2_43_596]KKT53132.1 MAG: hypothetical protein UW46_C0006G0033 [Candidatus Yanofskybacteria bacterium GW2011_GWF1_44_227]OGN35519.1 MAG: hypothetical protein A2207_02145 [Candidatus Yano